ncbi:MAG: sugar isomerase domain-containing protein [Terriglobia bacterium]
MDPTIQFFDAIRAAISRVEMDSLRTAAEIVAATLEGGGIIHTFGTGHSSLLAQEMFYRAGGLVAVNPILDPRLGFEYGAFESTAFERSADGAARLAEKAGFRAGDTGIIISNSGRNPLPVEMALRMKAAGLKLIVLTNIEQSRASASRHALGKRLFELADAVLDNHCPSGDAAVQIEGLAQRLGPLSTIMGASILHGVVLEAAAMLAAKGKPPATLISANISGPGTEDLHTSVEPYQERIRYYRTMVPGRDPV